MSQSPEVREKVGLFPGTFDPPTLGHLDIIRRGLEVCDRLIVAVAEGGGHHKEPLFSADERVALMRAALPAEIAERVTVKRFTGLLVGFAESEGVHLIVRGLRVISDFEYEFQMALMNKRLWPRVETIFLMPAEEYIYLNSSVVKEVARNGGPTEEFVAPNIAAALAARLGQ